MRVILGSAVAATLAFSCLLMAIERLVPYATVSPIMIAAREGGPAVYGWLSSRDR